MEDKLNEYRKKRKFAKTPEPKGEISSGKKLPIFVIQKHEASHLHFDFRLEVEGVLKSWAVPKEPPLKPSEKKLAVMVEDHPFEYKDFEGIIPKGNYGAGGVMVWDTGTYTPKDDIKKGIQKGGFAFFLHGTKLNGKYSLAKISKDEKNSWLLIRNEPKPQTKKLGFQKSAVTGRTMEQIKSQSEDPIPEKTIPMLATLTEEAFNNSDWIFEIKWDGYRAIAQIENGKVSLYSRNLKSFNGDYPQIVASLETIQSKAVLDGEVVVQTDDGKSSFQLLQNYPKTKKGNLVYYVFDIIYLNGKNLTSIPLIERKAILKEFLPKLKNVKFSGHIPEKGLTFYKEAQKLNLEGIIAKDKNSLYYPGKRTRSWLKIKTAKRQEAVIAGFTRPRGSRKILGSLVLGVYKNGNLVYIGHTGSGMDETTLQTLKEKVEPLIQKNPPFAKAPKTNEPATWVKPELVCEVKFSEWTQEGSLRHPIFVGLREDKNPKDIIREKPQKIFLEKENPAQLTIENKKITITNPKKVYWPQEGYTKKDMVFYYKEISGFILPYLKDRPQSLHRYPNGISQKAFYQKNIDFPVPNWVETVKIYSESENREINYLLCQNAPTLVYLANLGCIEINPWNSKIQTLQNPDFMILDLDPHQTPFSNVIKTALVAEKFLDELKIPSYPKTSGATGLHIYIPLQAEYSYEQIKNFGHILAALISSRLPKITSIVRSPQKRKGKVYIDYLQNLKGQTIVAPYSLRPKPKAPVSTPLFWEEVGSSLNPESFNIKTIFKRLEKVGDIFKPVLEKGIDIAAVLDILNLKNNNQQSKYQ